MMPARQFDMDAPALAAISAEASAICAARLARVAGTHALLLDGTAGAEPSITGVACWTSLRPGRGGAGWAGPLRVAADELPFGDESFCAVLVRFADRVGVDPETVAGELARVLANHGTLLVAGLHPRSLWHVGVAPGRWECALRTAGLDVTAALRCGSPWPRARGAAGVPKWLVRCMGGAYVIEAHRRFVNAIPLRKSVTSRRAVEAKPVLPGANRQSA